MIHKKEIEILEFVKKNIECSSKEIHDGIKFAVSYATVKRILTKLTSDNLLLKNGKGKGTKYLISPSYELLYPVEIGRASCRERV